MGPNKACSAGATQGASRAEALREELARYAHDAWSGWMEYMFGKSITLPDGGVLIPPPSAERWKRQMKTSYDELTEHEKESDRAEADKMLQVMWTLE